MKKERKFSKTADGKIEFSVADKYTNMETNISVHEREGLTLTGKLAFKLVEHFGIVAAHPDGFDEAGRQKMALLPPDAAVERALDIAERMVGALEERGHTYLMPSMENALDDSE